MRQDKWISTEEQLPAPLIDVLITVAGMSGPDVHCGFLMPDGEWIYTGTLLQSIIDPVTHWMEMPTPAQTKGG